MRHLLICWTVAVFASACSHHASLTSGDRLTEAPLCQDEFATGIVNGRLVKFDEPLSKEAVLLLIERDGKKSFCTAVPISSRNLLTAAHCIFGTSASSVQAVFYTRSGCPSGGNRRLALQAQKLIPHQNFDGTPESLADLALIRLVRDIPADYPVATLLERDTLPIEDDLELLGYGITDEFRQDGMRLRTITKSYRKDALRKPPALYFNQRQGTGGFCRGDSGAPVFARVNGAKKLMAINSMNIGIEKNKECQTASAAMYIPHFSIWIKKQILEISIL